MSWISALNNQNDYLQSKKAGYPAFFYVKIKSMKTEMLNQLMTGLILVSLDRSIQYVNDSAEALIGLSREKIKQEPINSIGLEISDSVIRKVLENQESVNIRKMQVHRYGRGRQELDVSISPLLNDADEVEGAILELVETSRYKNIEGEMSLTNQHQVSNLFLRGIAHEIKNPISGLKGASQLLELDLGKNEFTEIIIKECDRLVSILNRMTAPSDRPNIEAVQFHNIIEHGIRVLSGSHPEIKIKRDYDPSIPCVWVDENYLTQVMINLIKNALEAMEGVDEGLLILRTRVERNITLADEFHRTIASIQVIDNGSGIADEMLETIFLPMVTSKAEGTGLGLPISQELIHRCGGLIKADSEPGKTVFTIYLPLAK